MEENKIMHIADQVKRIIEGDHKEFRREKFSPSSWQMDDLLNAVTYIGRTITPSFVIDNDNKFAYTNMIYWLMGDSRMMAVHPTTGEIIPGDVRKGIYLGGPVGTGKTLATEILYKLCYSIGLKYRIGTDTPLSFKWKNLRSDELVRLYVREGSIDEIMREPILCVQDLASEPVEAVYMGNRVNVLRELIEWRGDRRDKMTFFTSNLMFGGAEMLKRYGDRANSRLEQMCNLIVLKGEDRRKK